ncbi:hypothetical protein TNCV_3544671, partial [Trichonephila clavipes]
TAIREKSHFTATPNSIALSLSLITTMCYFETPVAYVILILHHLDRSETASITVLTVAFLTNQEPPLRYASTTRRLRHSISSPPPLNELL